MENFFFFSFPSFMSGKNTMLDKVEKPAKRISEHEEKKTDHVERGREREQ